MKNYLFLAMTAIALASCDNNEKPVDLTPRKIVENYEQGDATPNVIGFDYVATRLDKQKDMIEVKGFLVNDNPDTAYFLTTTCNGEQYSLVIDTLKYEVVPVKDCSESAPVLKSIPPRSRYTFEAKLKTTARDEKIRLGFDYFTAERGMAVNGRTHNAIHNRLPQDKYILWTDERLIE